jgi:hypothetical protein
MREKRATTLGRPYKCCLSTNLRQREGTGAK